MLERDATALLAAFASGEADPAEVMAATLARIDAREPVLNAHSARSATAMAEGASRHSRGR